MSPTAGTRLGTAPGTQPPLEAGNDGALLHGDMAPEDHPSARPGQPNRLPAEEKQPILVATKQQEEITMRIRLAFLFAAAALALPVSPAAAQPVLPPGTQKVHPGPTLPPLPGLAKITSVTWSGTCGKAGNLVVTIRNAGGTAITCHGVVSVSRGNTPGGPVAGTAEFTGLAPGETKTFTILVDRMFNCCPHDCWVVTMTFDPDCREGQPWDHAGKMVCVAQPSQASLLVSPLSIPR